MTNKYNEEITQRKKQNLIQNLALLLNEYMYQANKKIAEKREVKNNQKEIYNHFYNIMLIVSALDKQLQNPEEQKTHIELFDSIKPYHYLVSSNSLTSLDNLALLDQLKETIKKMDQLLRVEYLPTRLEKIYEAIKTLLSKLIILFAPFTGRPLINESAQTLTSTRSTLFSQIETMKKSLNSPDDSKAEANLINP